MADIPQFNQQEMEYLHDTSFLLSKRKIIQQLQELLAETQQELGSLLQKHKQELPPNCLRRAGKISRGENYKGLPYLMLDYPRLLSREDVFAFRSMFWWGNFFSCSLHLQGKSIDRYRHALQHNLSSTQAPELYICVHDTPWEYHYRPNNYQLISELSAGEIRELLQRDFCKISRKTTLDNYPQLPQFARNCLQEFLNLLHEPATP